MRILDHFETLLFYDAPQVFTAVDQVGAWYVCTLVEENADSNKYLCAPASALRIKSFAEGALDLRTIYEKPELDELYIVEARSNDLMGLCSVSVNLSDVQPSWIPDPGFYLKTEKPHAKVAEEAMEKQRGIIHCRLNPPEAERESKITAEHLGQGVRLIQRLVKQAYRKSLKAVDATLRPTISSADNYELEVVAFSGGSFTVHMQSANRADLLGFAQISRAFEMIDLISERVDNPELAVNKVAEYGGHFATAYKDLVKFISETGTPIEYEWSMPEQKTAKRYKITTSQAKPIYEEIIKRTELEGEEVRLVGKLTKVDEKYRAWRLVKEDDQKEYGGYSERDLAGLVIETQRYEFICEERLEEERGTGREVTKLYLKEFNIL